MTLAFDILIPATIIAAVPMARDIYKALRAHKWEWASQRIAAGNQYMEEKEKLKAANVGKEEKPSS